MKTLEQLNAEITDKVRILLPQMVGITKREIIMQLKKTPLFEGMNYDNHTRHQLIEMCVRFDIDPISDYHKRRSGKTLDVS